MDRENFVRCCERRRMILFVCDNLTAQTSGKLKEAVANLSGVNWYGLTAQTSDKLKEAVANLSGVNWYGLANATDLWQMIDAGYAELLKTHIRQAHHAWLDDEEHAEL